MTRQLSPYFADTVSEVEWLSWSIFFSKPLFSGIKCIQDREDSRISGEPSIFYSDIVPEGLKSAKDIMELSIDFTFPSSGVLKFFSLIGL